MSTPKDSAPLPSAAALAGLADTGETPSDELPPLTPLSTLRSLEGTGNSRAASPLRAKEIEQDEASSQNAKDLVNLNSDMIAQLLAFKLSFETLDTAHTNTVTSLSTSLYPYKPSLDRFLENEEAKAACALQQALDESDEMFVSRTDIAIHKTLLAGLDIDRSSVTQYLVKLSQSLTDGQKRDSVETQGILHAIIRAREDAALVETRTQEVTELLHELEEEFEEAVELKGKRLEKTQADRAVARLDKFMMSRDLSNERVISAREEALAAAGHRDEVGKQVKKLETSRRKRLLRRAGLLKGEGGLGAIGGEDGKTGVGKRKRSKESDSTGEAGPSETKPKKVKAEYDELPEDEQMKLRGE